MIQQGTPEWLALRVGKITASRIKDVMASGKGAAESATRAAYRAQIVAERLTGLPQDSGFSSDAMRRGTEMEPFGRAAYEAAQGVLVDQVAFVEHPTIPNAGCSPDGLVGEDGGCEGKCPNTSTHLGWILAGEVPRQHLYQMHWSMACTGRSWWDFWSFDDRLPDDLQLFIRRLERDDKAIAEIERAVIAFDAECEEMVQRLKRLSA